MLQGGKEHLWPEQSHTSPNITSISVTEVMPSKIVMVYGPPAGTGGSCTFHVKGPLPLTALLPFQRHVEFIKRRFTSTKDAREVFHLHHHGDRREELPVPGTPKPHTFDH